MNSKKRFTIKANYFRDLLNRPDNEKLTIAEGLTKMANGADPVEAFPGAMVEAAQACEDPSRVFLGEVNEAVNEILDKAEQMEAHYKVFRKYHLLNYPSGKAFEEDRETREVTESVLFDLISDLEKRCASLERMTADFCKNREPGKQKTEEEYTPEDYRSFINFLLDRIDNIRMLRRILDIVNRMFVEN